MDLDLNTLLYAGIAVAVLAAAVLSFFGATQGTHPGFRSWLVAQWLLVAGLLLNAVFDGHAFITTLVALLVVSTIKIHSHTSCPWDLQQFGGVASHVSHWAWGVADGGTGRCFPAGHASAGFAFIGGFFAFRHVLPKTAWRWFTGAMLVGFILGLAQQLRGAHYMSHTLWTAWFCWTVAAVVDGMVSQLIARNSLRAQARVPVLSTQAPLTPAE